MSEYHCYPVQHRGGGASVFRLLAAQKTVILFVPIVTALLTVGALRITTPEFTSQARILIEYNQPVFSRPRSEGRKSSRRVLLTPEAVSSEVQVLLSRELAQQVIDDLNIWSHPDLIGLTNAGSPIKRILTGLGVSSERRNPAVDRTKILERFEKRLEVRHIKDSRVVAIYFRSSDPQLAASVANRLADAYIDRRRRRTTERISGAGQWLRVQISRLRTEVEALETNLEKLRLQSGLVPGQAGLTLDAQLLAGVNRQLVIAKTRRADVEARAAQIEKVLAANADLMAVPDIATSALVQRLQEQKGRVDRAIAELAPTLRRAHPRIAALEAERTALRGQIRVAAATIVEGLRHEARIAAEWETALTSRLEKLKREAATTRRRKAALDTLEQEAVAKRKLLETYLARYPEANAHGELNTLNSHATIIERAHLERVPRYTDLPSIVGFAALVALIVSLLSGAAIRTVSGLDGAKGSAPR